MDQSSVFQDTESLLTLVAIISMTVLSMTLMIGGLWAALRSKRMTEETRREIAAYLAEGTITPEDAETLMRGRPKTRPTRPAQPASA
ncbi:MAG: hypothetical protein RIB60_01895 [Phycisphaerales bacterium]